MPQINELVTQERMGGLSESERYGFFCGVFMQKCWQELFQIEVLLNRIKAARIVELGSGSGGTSLFLAIQSLVRGMEFYTYECGSENWQQQMNFETRQAILQMGGNVVLKDIFEVEAQIGGVLSRDGVSLLYCDAGNAENGKVRTVELLAPYLKSGDYLLVHDHYTTEYPADKASQVASANQLDLVEDEWFKSFNAKHGAYVKR